MNRRLVVACFGDEGSAESIRPLTATADVIAVALDLGGAVALGTMRDVALAAGAIRCHALDVREEFAREVLWPAVMEGLITDPVSARGDLAGAFVAKKLDEIAQLEGAIAIHPGHIAVATRALGRAPASPLHVRIGFEDGTPVSINGVRMTLTELMDSIETITGEPALYVLRREMARSHEPQHA